MSQGKAEEFDPGRPDLVREKNRTGEVREQTKSNTEGSPAADDQDELNRPEGSATLMDPVITANPD